MSSGSTGDAARKASGSASRLWVALGATFTLFLAWAAIAAQPWAPARPVPPDSRLVALQARQQRLNRTAGLTDEVVRRRWVAYQAELAARRQEIAAVELRHQRELSAAAAAAAAITERRREEVRAARDARVATNAALASQSLPAAAGAPPAAPAPAPTSPPPASRLARPAQAVAPPPPPVAPVAPPVPAVQPPPRVAVVTLPPIASTRTS